jgi:hypothetical protein
MSNATDLNTRGAHRARAATKPSFGFFGEWVFHFVLFTAVIGALFQSAVSLNGVTIV